MSKEVQMAFRVEQDLRESFTEAAEREHRPAAQVLRKLMRQYVDQVSERHGEEAISAAEKRRRSKAIAFARGSVALEGFTVTDEVDAISQQFIEGELNFDEMTEAMNARDGKP